MEAENADGRDVIGLYVLNEDNTCHLLCTDFDDKNCEHGYQNDVLAFIDVCKGWNIPCSVERSRSGNGAHVWIFFEVPVLAVKLREAQNLIRQCRKQLSDADEQVRHILDAPSVATNAFP